jgi:hypothetical protein
MKDLDEILNKDQESKINWLVGEMYYLKQEIKTIKSNHLHHINEDIVMLKRKLYIISGIIVSFLTGQNLLM